MGITLFQFQTGSIRSLPKAVNLFYWSLMLRVKLFFIPLNFHTSLPSIGGRANSLGDRRHLTIRRRIHLFALKRPIRCSPKTAISQRLTVELVENIPYWFFFCVEAGPVVSEHGVHGVLSSSTDGDIPWRFAVGVTPHHFQRFSFFVSPKL